MDMNTSIVYKKLLEFKNRHPGTIAWRLRGHAQVIGKHLATDEKVIYAADKAFITYLRGIEGFSI